MRTLKIFPASWMLLLLGAALLVSCKKDDTTDPDNTTNTTTDSPSTTNNPVDEGLPGGYKYYYNVEDIYEDGDYMVIKAHGLPDHPSPYYESTQWESTLYEAYNGSNPSYHTNPNRIASQNYTFRIPLKPVASSNPQATPMGAIGIAINGIPFFNQYAAGGAPLTNEINSFDQYNGHPTGTSAYHYHVEPLWLTTAQGKDGLLGYLLDGFPVYGPEENGQPVPESDLDAYHGHSHATAEYPAGIYHYHTTSVAPYLNGDGFYGNAGTVSQ